MDNETLAGVSSVRGDTTSNPIRALTPPERASQRGHVVVWDPPPGMTSVERWSCACGCAVIRYGAVVYGSAIEVDCDHGE